MHKLWKVTLSGDDHKAADAVIDDYNLDITKTHGMVTPIMYAIKLGCSRIVELLISRGADIVSKQEDWRPLDLAVRKEHVEVVRVLLAAGCPLTVESSSDEDIQQILAEEKKRRNQPDWEEQLRDLQRRRETEIASWKQRRREALEAKLLAARNAKDWGTVTHLCQLGVSAERCVYTRRSGVDEQISVKDALALLLEYPRIFDMNSEGIGLTKGVPGTAAVIPFENENEVACLPQHAARRGNVRCWAWCRFVLHPMQPDTSSPFTWVTRFQQRMEQHDWFEVTIWTLTPLVDRTQYEVAREISAEICPDTSSQPSSKTSSAETQATSPDENAPMSNAGTTTMEEIATESGGNTKGTSVAATASDKETKESAMIETVSDSHGEEKKTMVEETSTVSHGSTALKSVFQKLREADNLVKEVVAVFQEAEKLCTGDSKKSQAEADVEKYDSHCKDICKLVRTNPESKELADMSSRRRDMLPSAIKSAKYHKEALTSLKTRQDAMIKKLDDVLKRARSLLPKQEQDVQVADADDVYKHFLVKCQELRDAEVPAPSYFRVDEDAFQQLYETVLQMSGKVEKLSSTLLANKVWPVVGKATEWLETLNGTEVKKGKLQDTKDELKKYKFAIQAMEADLRGWDTAIKACNDLELAIKSMNETEPPQGIVCIGELTSSDSSSSQSHSGAQGEPSDAIKCATQVYLDQLRVLAAVRQFPELVGRVKGFCLPYMKHADVNVSVRELPKDDDDVPAYSGTAYEDLMTVWMLSKLNDPNLVHLKSIVLTHPLGSCAPRLSLELSHLPGDSYMNWEKTQWNSEWRGYGLHLSEGGTSSSGGGPSLSESDPTVEEDQKSTGSSTDGCGDSGTGSTGGSSSTESDPTVGVDQKTMGSSTDGSGDSGTGSSGESTASLSYGESKAPFDDGSEEKRRELLVLLKDTGVLKGLRYLHKMRIVHSDLTPRNIALGTDNRAVICNIGKCLFVESKNMPKVGNAPLQRIIERKHRTDQYTDPSGTFTMASDVYSAGMIILTALGHGSAHSPDNDLPAQLDDSENIYTVLKSMVHSQPEERPTITDVLQYDNPILQTIRDYASCKTCESLCIRLKDQDAYCEQCTQHVSSSSSKS